MSKQLWPRSEKPFVEPTIEDRPWVVDFDLAYDGGGSRWRGYYRTKTGARVSAWWHYHIASWGGSAQLSDRRSINVEKN